MTIFSDAAGFKYMGDCQWGTLNILYPSQSYLEAFPHGEASTELASLLSNSGLLYNKVATQTELNALNASFAYFILARFGWSGDINNRYLFFVYGWNNTGQSIVYAYNNSGDTNTVSGNDPSSTNRLYRLGGGININNNSPRLVPSSSTISPIQWVGASDGNYLALALFQRNFGTNSASLTFLYAGKFVDVNTNFNYYSASNITNGITMNGCGLSSVSNGIFSGHYIANTAKNTLQTGDAIYPIACSDGQTPGSQWATDFYAFDNNSTLGFPAMGRVRGMLLGTGTYTLGKPVKIQGSVFPDGGSPWYLPVGTYAGKTLLMRCYSSMS